MVLQVLALLGLAGIVQHEINLRRRQRAQIDVLRRSQYRNRRGF